MRGAYLDLTEKQLDERADAAYEIYRECRVCPNGCGVNRVEGQTGVCRQTDRLLVSAAVRHFGEEIPLTGINGVGNIFLTSCNLRCAYCQNFQISQDRLGVERSYADVADEMLRLQAFGVHFIGWVSPSHVVPGLLKSLAVARKKGLHLPIVYNTNAYDAVPTLKLLDGIVDIYLPDLKYADNAIAGKYSHANGYVDFSREAVLEMFRQVGPMTVDASGLAQRGLMVRHLVLPNNISGTWEVLCFVALELSKRVPLSLMSQYRPVNKAPSIPELARRVTLEEYDKALHMAADLGFETLFVQDLNSEMHNLPDFTRTENPFPLDRPHNSVVLSMPTSS